MDKVYQSEAQGTYLTFVVVVYSHEKSLHLILPVSLVN